MSPPRTERRGTLSRDSGKRRRTSDIDELNERVEDAENRLKLLDGENGLLQKMVETRAEVRVILEMVQMYLPNINQKANKATSFWTIVAALSAIIVPITVALIGGYFLLRSNLPTTP